MFKLLDWLRREGSDFAVTLSRVPRAGVVGWPIKHSRSPIIHRHWLKELGIAGSYERFAVPPGQFCRLCG